MEKIEFRDAWCEISRILYGEAEGAKLYEQYHNNSNLVFANQNHPHNSSCYDFHRIMRVFSFLDFRITSGEVELFYMPFPFKEKNIASVIPPEVFWFERHLFYSCGGLAQVSGKLYALLFSINVFDPLIIDTVEPRLFNHKYISTPYMTKLESILEQFREKYGAEYRKVQQNEFLDFVNRHITADIGDHDLKCLWRAIHQD